MDEGLASVSAFPEERLNLQTLLLVVIAQLFVPIEQSITWRREEKKVKELSQIHSYVYFMAFSGKKKIPNVLSFKKPFGPITQNGRAAEKMKHFGVFHVAYILNFSAEPRG